MTKAILLGDPHLGGGCKLGKVSPGSTINSRITDQFRLLDWTLDEAVSNEADHIVITGDVFDDPKPNPYIITLFVSWLKRCQLNNVNVNIIVGNHDVLRSGGFYNSPLDIIHEMDLYNVQVFNQIDSIVIDTCAFTFVPFRDRKSFFCQSNIEAINIVKESLVYELAIIPLTYTKVLVGHLAIEGSIPVGNEISDLANELLCPLSIFNGYDYVWMGHVHKPQVMSKSPYVAHIGSMDISNFGETDHKKHIVIFDCQSSKFEIKYLPTRSIKKIEIVIPTDNNDPTSFILNELKNLSDFDKSVVKIDISSTDINQKQINKSVIEEYLNSQGVFNVAGISESKKINLVKKEDNSIDTKMDTKSAIRAYVEKFVDKDISSQTAELALKILEQFESK